MSSRKTVTLYNVMFPLWMILAISPVAWLMVLPGNFIIDSIVLLISLKILKESNIKQIYKNHIWKIFGFGLLSDIIGSLFMLSMAFIGLCRMGDEWYITIPAIIISSFAIYKFNYKFTFKTFDDTKRHNLSLIFAIVTAPYTFLVPSSWIYY